MPNTTRVITALIAGAAVGAVIALLLSPDNGEENRDTLADWVRGARYKAGSLAERGINAVRSITTQDLTDIPDEVERSLGV